MAAMLASSADRPQPSKAWLNCSLSAPGRKPKRSGTPHTAAPHFHPVTGGRGAITGRDLRRGAVRSLLAPLDPCREMSEQHRFINAAVL